MLELTLRFGHPVSVIKKVKQLAGHDLQLRPELIFTVTLEDLHALHTPALRCTVVTDKPLLTL